MQTPGSSLPPPAPDRHGLGRPGLVEAPEPRRRPAQRRRRDPRRAVGDGEATEVLCDQDGPLGGEERQRPGLVVMFGRKKE